MEETEVLSSKILASLMDEPAKDKALVLALHGDLGAGKTAFVKGIAKAFGIKDVITSPTFVIEKIYKLEHPRFEHLIHIDAYRLEKAAELLHLGWKEIVENPKNLICIEWPERVEEIVPSNVQEIFFTFIDEKTREIRIA